MLPYEDQHNTTESISPRIHDSKVITLETPLPDHHVAQTHPNTLRRSHREPKEPLWLTDYVTTRKIGNTTLYPIHNYATYANLSTSCPTYLGVFSSVVEPRTFQEDSKDPRWVEAMQTKIQALQANNTWELVLARENNYRL